MVKTKTELKFENEFWAIVRSGDVKGYHTGTPSMETAIYGFDTAKELEEFIADGSVESGESMGDYCFNVIKVSHSWEILRQLVECEEAGDHEEQDAYFVNAVDANL